MADNPFAVDNRRNADALNSRLRQVPTYQAALAGQDFGFGFPVGPDGKVLPGFRVMNAREAAKRAGVHIGPGYVDPSSGEFKDPDSALARNLLARPEIMIPLVLGGAYGTAALMGPAASSVPALGNVNAITDSLAASHAAGASSAAAGLGNVNAIADGLAGGGTASVGVRGALRNLVPNSIRDIAQLAPLAAMPFVNSGGGNPFSSDEEQALLDEIRQGMAMQRRRVEQTQPVFDDLVRRTQASAPNASYGGPAYAYQGPRFGGQ